MNGMNLGAAASNTTVTSGVGYASQAFPVPNDPSFMGMQLSVQAGVLGASIDMTNAIDVTIG